MDHADKRVSSVAARMPTAPILRTFQSRPRASVSALRPARARRPLLRTWLASFAVLFVAAAAWSFASPLGSAPDEPAQLVRAASVVRGQLLGSPLPHAAKSQGSTVVVEVPEVFASLNWDVSCFRGLVDVPAGCQAPLANSTQDEPMATYVGRYPPLYYVLVGLPTLLFVSVKGIYGARLMSAALSAAMLALAVVSVRRCRGRPLLGAGLSLAATPMVLYLAGVINPSGLEVSSAISGWAAAMALTSATKEELRPSLVAPLGISLVSLVLVRSLSPLWALAILSALIVLRPGVPVRELYRLRSVKAWSAAVVLASGLALGWDLVAGALRGQAGTPLPPGASEPEVVQLAFDHLHALVLSTIGQFGWLETPSPFAVVALWLGALGAVVLLALCAASRREATAVAGLLLGWALFSFLFVLAFAREYGIVGQGRDFMGLIVGLPLLAGLAARGPAELVGPMKRLSGLLVVSLALGQVVDFYGTLRRFTVGLPSPATAFASVPGGWQPPMYAPLLVAVFALSMGGFAAILLRPANRARELFVIGGLTERVA